jgi:hypothetical protein
MNLLQHELPILFEAPCVQEEWGPRMLYCSQLLLWPRRHHKSKSMGPPVFAGHPPRPMQRPFVAA